MTRDEWRDQLQAYRRKFNRWNSDSGVARSEIIQYVDANLNELPAAAQVFYDEFKAKTVQHQSVEAARRRR